MLRDAQGHPVSTDHAGTVAAIDAFAAEILSHGKGATAILDGVAADRTCALAQAYAGALYLFLQTAEGPVKAAPYLKQAAALAGTATERERTIVAALCAWGRGDAATAVAGHLEASRRWPRDLLQAKLAQIHQLNAGDRQGMRDSACLALEANRDRGHAWGLAAFGLEQAGDAAGAEAHGRLAVSLEPTDGWAHHAVAHVLTAAGRVSEGAAWMERHAGSWDRCSSFMYTHNWWHTALLYIELDRPDQALGLWDGRVWGVRKGYIQDQVNAVSLLSRLELAGVRGTAARWQDVAAHARARRHDHQNGFLDLHVLYALARAGDDIALCDMLGSLRDHAFAQEGAAGPLWRGVALPAARGLAAHARGDHPKAAALLGPVLGELGRLGGSTAQQGWFTLLYRDSLLKAARPQPKPLGWRLPALAAVPA